MPNYRTFSERGHPLRIEVEDGPVTGPSSYAEALVSAVKAVASAITDDLNDSTKGAEQAPEVTIEFGLKGLAAGGYAVARGDVTANFRVTIRIGGGATASALSPERLAGVI